MDPESPGQHRPGPYTGAGCRRYRRQQMAAATPPQRLSPRPGAGRPLRSGSRANAPRAPLTRQAIQTPRYPGAIFSRYGGRCSGVQPPSASFCRGTRYTVELFGRTRPPLQARANAKPQGKGQFTLDLTWTAIDRDLWPLGSWNKSPGSTAPSHAMRDLRAKARACYRSALSGTAGTTLRC